LKDILRYKSNYNIFILTFLDLFKATMSRLQMKQASTVISSDIQGNEVSL